MTTTTMTTSIHTITLDGIATVNSLFTTAAFLGLALNPADPNYTFVNSTCAATLATAERMVAFHVYSFLFSSLEQAIRTAAKGHGEVRYVATAHVSKRALPAGIMVLAMGSALGCVLLTLALVDLIQIKLGSSGCWGWYNLAAVGPLVVLVPSVLVFYICIVLHAFSR